MKTDIFVYDDATNGTTVVQGDIDLLGHLFNIRVENLHIAIRTDDVRREMDSDDGR